MCTGGFIYTSIDQHFTRLFSTTVGPTEPTAPTASDSAVGPTAVVVVVLLLIAIVVVIVIVVVVLYLRRSV